jgi:hypothetical protein
MLLATAVRAVLAVCALGAIGTANASPYITGSLWEVSNAAASSATPATVTGLGPAQVSFQADAVAFSSFGNALNSGNGSLDYTIGLFLNSLGAASSIVVTPAGLGASVSLGDALDKNGGGVIMDLTGSAFFTTGQPFTVAHDDGLTMVVNGTTILSAAGPTSPVTTPFTYSGPTGNFNFDIVYGECCGPPAVLETTLVQNQSVPEPATLGLVGIALAGLGFSRRRKQG